MTETDDFNIVCYGGARPEDTHLLSTIHCVDDEIHQWLQQRERRKQRRRGKENHDDATRESRA
jgi:hypothetical protein